MSSLDTLASYLSEFPNLRSQFTELPEDKLQLFTKKGIYCYDFMDSFEKFNFESLPTKDQFYNRLEDKHILNRQYEHAQNVWTHFNIKNVGEYTDLYLKTDVMILSDIFEEFRTSCLKTYSLDPAHFYTLPGYTWQCMLKYTGQELELLTDVDQLNFIKRGIRGGLSQCMKRRSSANNKYMKDKYNPAKPIAYNIYYDINNQYGLACSQFLPYGGFEWVDPNIDVTEIPNDSPIGYFLEVDLHYPEYLHDLHKDLPFCPEHQAPPGKKEKKLLATLYDKQRYIIHYRNLKQALAYGLVLKKVHRVLKFKQAPWLQPYINLNTELRKSAKNDFEKNLFKLMNNAVFGKTIENVDKYSIVKLITRWQGRYGAEALIAKPEFKSALIFDENLVAIELNKTEVFYNKPVYAGMAILDLAKTTIYDFHYGYMIPTFGRDHCTALYTDTDSLIYEIKDHDVYEIMRRDCYERFDTSDYPLHNIYNIPQVNKKVLGLMKDENNGSIMTDFIGLRSKMYCTKILVTDEDIAKKRAKLLKEGYNYDEIEDCLNNVGLSKKIKGVKKNVIKTKITFDDYVNCLENLVDTHSTQNLIKTDKHKIYSITQKKVALSAHDDKRYLIKDSSTTLPYGHYSIMDID